jgi:arylsulfatase A-like enzyme
LSLYGYPRPTTPFLESLQPRALVFELAIAQFPNTLASHMSIFTGLYPAEHGVYPPSGVLPAGIETLPEAFSRAGFRTAGFTEGGYMRGRPGFRRGFDEWHASSRRDPREMERTVARGVEFLRALSDDDRFFLFLHTYAPHAPYAPPDAYRDRYWKRADPAGARPSDRELTELNERGERLQPDVLEWYVALYDATINYVDDVLADLFAQLEALGLDDDTTIVVTSDHGEEFQEHGRLKHRLQLYDESIHVPLVLAGPTMRAARVAAQAQGIDLFPTVAALLGAAAPADLPGQNLLAERPPLPAFSETRYGITPDNGQTDTLSLTTGAWKLIHAPALGRFELYDLAHDPGERENRFGRAPEGAELAARLAAWQSVAPAPPPSAGTDPAMREKLRALGYVD